MEFKEETTGVHDDGAKGWKFIVKDSLLAEEVLVVF